MLKLEKLKLYFEKNLNDLQVLAELRNDLKNIDSNDLVTIEDHIKYLELLKAFRVGVANSDKLKGDNYPALLQSLLSVGEDGVYSNSLRFIYELIQNVDDCDYENPHNAKLKIRFHIDKGIIELTYNEKGFTPFNVFAITGIAEAAKNITSGKTEIGEKGIGFKSVFGVATKVIIQSGKFSFSLDKNNFTVPNTEYNNFNELSGTKLTLIASPEDVNNVYRAFFNEYCKKDSLLNKNPLLFLNKLTELHIYVDQFRSLNFKVTRSSSCIKEKALLVEDNVVISADLKDHYNGIDNNSYKELKCIRYSKPIKFNKEMCISRYGENTKLDNKEMYMHIVIPVPDELYLDDPIKTGTLYSFLPTKIRINSPLVCHIPFKLDASREFVDAQKNNLWFRHCTESFSAMLNEVYINLASKIKNEIINYLPHHNAYFFDSENSKVDCLKQLCFKGRKFLELPIFYTVENEFRKANQIICFSDQEDIPDPITAYLLLDDKRELFLFPQKRTTGNPGIFVLKDVNDKLFTKALKDDSSTKDILELLSKVKSFSFTEAIKASENHTFTLDHIRTFAFYPDCSKAFRDFTVKSVRGNTSQKYYLNTDIIDILDVKNIDSNGEPFDKEDFDKNALNYLTNSQFRCTTIDNVPDDFFFITKNVLVLSKKNSIKALSNFCDNVDTDSSFSLSLKFRACSNELNQTDSSISSFDYLKKLRAVRKAIREGFGNRAYQNYIKLINESGTDSERYIYELLQNADDCKYSDDVTPEFNLVISDSNKVITTRYNEIGFTKDNVRAITAIGESTKKQLLSSNDRLNTEIGEKGVGFKSVFSVASNVEIRSNEFNFSLSDKEPTIPKILDNDTSKTAGTVMKFTLKKPITSNFFTEEKVLNMCLCLRNLRTITLGQYHIVIEDSVEGQGTRKITINNKTYDFYRLEHRFKVTDIQALSERKGEHKQISDLQAIYCYVPKTSSKAKQDYYVYSGLPTNIKSNIPLVLDAPFELTTSRTSIINNWWNNYIKKEMYKAILYVMNSLKHIDGINVLRFLNVKKESTSKVSLDMFNYDYLNSYDIFSNIQEAKILPTCKDNHFVSPNNIYIYKAPSVINYLIERDVEISCPLEQVLKYKGEKYDLVLSYLGIKDMTLYNVIKTIENCYQEFCEDERFTSMLYNYLFNNHKELGPYRERLKSMCIIPVKPMKYEGTDFVCFSNKIFINDSMRFSPNSCDLLDTKRMSKEQYEAIFGTNLNELNEQMEETLYRKNLSKLLNESLSTTDEDLYEKLMGEFINNRKLLSQCIDTLKMHIKQIPLKNECGEIKRGHIYVSDEPTGYFEGNVLPRHIAHMECQAFAKFLGCKNIRNVYFEDLDITEALTDNDIEAFQDESIVNGFEILERCKRKGLVSTELVDRYKLGGLTAITIEYDDEIFNQPINYKFQQHMDKVLMNPVEIIPKKVERTVHYGKKKNGDEFEINNNDIRLLAMRRYSPERDYCVCQMCKEAKEKRYIEVNNIIKTPDYYWEETGVALCLICSKRFEELRSNSNKNNIYNNFLNTLKNVNPMVNHPISIPIGIDNITFSQTHIAEIQSILNYQDEHKKDNH